MKRLDSVVCGDGYTDAAKIDEVWGSNGGYFQIAGADVFLKLQHGKQGLGVWTEELHAEVGNGILAPGTTGVQFRNHAAGEVATVSAALSYPAEPPVALVAGGQANPGSSDNPSIPIILSASGTTTLVAGVVGQVIEVLGCYCMAGGTTTLQFQSSGGPSNLTGTLNFVNATGFVLNQGGGPWFKTLSGESLTIINGSNVVVGGVLVYRRKPG